jgi:hypothetical protein
MQLWVQRAKRRSISNDDAFPVYYNKTSTWGHRAWDNALVIYTPVRYSWALGSVSYATIFENTTQIRTIYLTAAYILEE